MNEEDEDYTMSAALALELNSAPWYVGSIFIHAMLFICLLMIPINIKTPKTPSIMITDIIENEVIEEEVKVVKEEVKPEVIETIVNNVDVNEVIVSTDVEISDTISTPDEMVENTALGDPDNISNVDSEFMGVPALMGVGSTGNSGGGGNLGTRTGGGKKSKVRIGGGNEKTEDSVNLALEWLAAHQESDGRWDCKKYGGGGHGGDDVAVTSMALLAFLGAGNSCGYGKYKRNVSDATDWLISQQDASGRIGVHRYVAGISTMAISESYGMHSKNSTLRDSAQRAVDYACKTQCPAYGWDYDPNSKRNDTSVTGWWIMGLKSACVSGLNVPTEVMDNALKYIRQVTNNEGKVAYSNKADKCEDLPSGGGSIRMSAVSMTCQQFLGQDRKDNKVVSSADLSFKQLPSVDNVDFYLWYYQALGFFQMGVRSQYWKDFNPRMVDSLLTLQVKNGTVEENKGSWNPEADKYGPSWGRVGQTALGALMLEIYYRYNETKK